jgi:hypothetical protein
MPLPVILSPIQDSQVFLPCSPGFSTWMKHGISMALPPSSGRLTKMVLPGPGVMGWIARIRVFPAILPAGRMGFRLGVLRISCEL